MDLNVNELYENSMQKRLKKYKTFDKILSQCCIRIKHYSKNEYTSCLFEVPEFIIGTPLYNKEELILYIIDSLRKKGLNIKLIYHNIIYISWDIKCHKKNVSNSLKNKTQNQSFRKVDEYDPTGNFVYNEKSLIDLENKSFNLFS